MEILRPCCHAVDAGQGHAVNSGGTHAVEADNRDFGSTYSENKNDGGWRCLIKHYYTEDVVCFYFATY